MVQCTASERTVPFAYAFTYIGTYSVRITELYTSYYGVDACAVHTSHTVRQPFARLTRFLRLSRPRFMHFTSRMFGSVWSPPLLQTEQWLATRRSRPTPHLPSLLIRWLSPLGFASCGDRGCRFVSSYS